MHSSDQRGISKTDELELNSGTISLRPVSDWSSGSLDSMMRLLIRELWREVSEYIQKGKRKTVFSLCLKTILTRSGVHTLPRFRLSMVRSFTSLIFCTCVGRLYY